MRQVTQNTDKLNMIYSPEYTLQNTQIEKALFGYAKKGRL